jgi:hypothetical protein
MADFTDSEGDAFSAWPEFAAEPLTEPKLSDLE